MVTKVACTALASHVAERLRAGGPGDGLAMMNRAAGRRLGEEASCMKVT